MFQLSSPAPFRTLAHGCQLNPRDGVNRSRALGRRAQPRSPLVVAFCEPFSSFGTAIQSSPKIFALSNTRSPKPYRSVQMLVMFSGGGSFSGSSRNKGYAPRSFYLWTMLPAASNQFKHLWTFYKIADDLFQQHFQVFFVNRIIEKSWKQTKIFPCDHRSEPDGSKVGRWRFWSIFYI